MLDAAVALFAEHGLGGTSVRDVAGAAGVSLAMVNHYFGSKDALYDACIEATYTELFRMRDQLALELAAKAPLRELFARAVATSFRFARKHRTAVRLLVRAAVSSGELTPKGRALLFDTLDLVTTTLSSTLARPASELRLPLQSIVFLVARYAAQGEAEMAAVAGMSSRDKRAALDAVETHLVRVAVELFDLPKRGSR
jgi:AcrR family transcriptional regulator